MMRRRLKSVGPYIVMLLLLGCEESLPERIVPQNTLRITEIIASQGSTNAGIYISFLITGENIYNDTFQDSVNVTGTIQISWIEDENVRATVPLDNRNISPPTRIEGDVLTLDPDERFYLTARWMLNLDDGRNFFDMLDFSDSEAVGGIIAAKPETLSYNTQLLLFDQTGIITSETDTFEVNGWKSDQSSSNP